MKTNTTKKQSIFFGMGLLCCLMLAFGCKPKDAKEPQKAGDTKIAAKDGKEVPKGPCGEYAAKLCEFMGEQSQDCESVKAASEIMPEAACKAGMTDVEFSKKKFSERRKVCDDLMNKLCTDVGPETESCEMVKKQTPSFDIKRCEMMMGRYDKILESLKSQEAAKKPLDAEKQKLIATGEGIAAVGPENAKVTVVEFSDFQCPYCSRAATAVNEIKKKYADKIRFIFRHFPLSFHNNAQLASEAAMAANAQGKFWQFHDKVFENQRALERADLEKYAKEVGLDVAKFKKALDDGTYKTAVNADLEIGKQASVSGTPTIFINGKRVSNPTSAEEISKDIDKLLAQ